MRIKGIIDEDFVNYRKPAMYIAFPTCSFKCDKLNGCDICQNSSLIYEPDIYISEEDIVARYLKNPITEAFIFSGLEPIDSILDVTSLIECIRNTHKCMDDIVIYTGYTEEEMPSVLANSYKTICQFPNIYIKFGRFIMNDTTHFDEVLGVTLASHNQYGKKVSMDET